MTDDGDRPVRAAAGPIVGFRQQPSTSSADAQDVEEPAADVGAVHELGLAARRQVELFRSPCEGAFEQVLLTGLDFVPDGIRPGSALELHERAGFAHGQRSKHESVEDRKEGGVGPDPEGQREDGQGADQRSRPEGPVGRRGRWTRGTTCPLDERHAGSTFVRRRSRSILVRPGCRRSCSAKSQNAIVGPCHVSHGRRQQSSQALRRR